MRYSVIMLIPKQAMACLGYSELAIRVWVHDTDASSQTYCNVIDYNFHVNNNQKIYIMSSEHDMYSIQSY